MDPKMPTTLFTPAHRLRAIIAGALLLAGIPGAHAQSEASAIHPSAWPQAHSPINVSPDIAALVHRVVSNMTLEEKVGQLLQADISSVTPEDVRRYHLGSVLAGGNSAPDQDVRVSATR